MLREIGRRKCRIRGMEKGTWEHVLGRYGGSRDERAIGARLREILEDSGTGEK